MNRLFRTTYHLDLIAYFSDLGKKFIGFAPRRYGRPYLVIQRNWGFWANVPFWMSWLDISIVVAELT